MRLFYGGCGDYFYFTVAKDKADALKNIRKYPGMAWLPVDVTEISDVDGYQICVTEPNTAKPPGEPAPKEIKQQGVKTNAGKTAGKSVKNTKRK